VPSVDFLGRPRPAGGQTLPAAGHLERHDTGVISTSVTDGAGFNSIQLTAYDDHEFYLPVNAVATTLSVDVQYDSSYGGTNYPQVVLTGGGQIGVPDQTLTATSAALNAWQTLSFSTFTPTAAGFLTLRFQSRSSAGAGHAYFAKPVY
jgi:hypothetical protein